jgi:hypothetical protein
VPGGVGCVKISADFTKLSEQTVTSGCIFRHPRSGCNEHERFPQHRWLYTRGHLLRTLFLCAPLTGCGVVRRVRKLRCSSCAGGSPSASSVQSSRPPWTLAHNSQLSRFCLNKTSVSPRASSRNAPETGAWRRRPARSAWRHGSSLHQSASRGAHPHGRPHDKNRLQQLFCTQQKPSRQAA